MRILLSKKLLNFLILFGIGQPLVAQYTVNGQAAQESCNQYRLTQFGGQSGSVWNNNKINLTQPIDFKFDVALSDPLAPPHDGADGIAFVLQPISTSQGGQGSGLGYQGISPAIGVTIDTYQNSSPDNDPFFDHIAIQLNGDLNHNTANNIAGPVTAISGNNNIEDGQWHSLRIVWDPATITFSAYVDGTLRVTAVRDLINTVFGGNPMVYWGFTGSTGAEFNVQKFRTALNPAFTFSPTQKKCVNEPITFNDATISFSTIAKFYWDFGDGSPIDSVNLNPVHTYLTGGSKTVVQRVIGADGCEATNTQTITVGSKPVAGFTYNNNCVPTSVPAVFFLDASSNAVGTINNNQYWDFGNGQLSSLVNPTTSYPAPGDKTVKHQVTSSEGCESDTLYQLVHMYTNPVTDFTFTDSVCLGTATSFFGTISNAAGDSGVLAWNWVIDNISSGVLLNVQNPTYTYLTPGNHTVLLIATHPNYNPSPGNTNSNACQGIAVKNVFVVDKPTAYFKFNTICQAQTVTFTDSSYSSDGVPINQWWWSLGNSGTSILPNPSGIYPVAGNDTIKLVVHNEKGCASDTLKRPVVINDKPIANFGYSKPVCSGNPVQFSDSSKTTAGTINQWSWIQNGIVWSTIQNATKTFISGTQTIQLVATNSIGCISDTVSKTFVIDPTPVVTMSFKDACKNSTVSFTCSDINAVVTQWKWTFGDGGTAATQNASHVYTANGAYKVKLYATAANGCYSDSLVKDINIYGTNAFAGNDTIVAAGQPLLLNASGGLSYSWTPAYLLSDPNIRNPITTLTSTQLFTLKAFTPEGCESYDDVLVKVYKGPEFYLPNAFTPNGDTKNDVFRGTPVGIKQFNYLKVFNRWGQLVFSSADYNKGWDGTWKGQKQPGGVYVVMANAIDFKGNVIDKKQTVMLIR